jgi:hypothetical protein
MWLKNNSSKVKNMTQKITTAQNGTMPAQAHMSDDDVLKYTRGIRVTVVKELMSENKAPVETGDRIMLTTLLKDLDSQAFSSKKLAFEEKKADSTAAVVAELLRSINKNTAFTVGSDINNSIVDITAQVVPSSILDVPALPGELEVSPPQMDYNTFVRSQGKDVDQIGRDVVHPEKDDDDDMP